MSTSSSPVRGRLAALTSAFLTGCTISTPQRVRPLAKGDNPDAQVFVSVTGARVQSGERAEFDRLTRRLHTTLEGQPGLLSHSIRREVFGLQAWTLTAWSSEAARDSFFRSPMHLEAMTTSAKLLAEVRVRRLTLRRNELPLSWNRALELLEKDPEASPPQTVAEVISPMRN